MHDITYDMIIHGDELILILFFNMLDSGRNPP